MSKKVVVKDPLKYPIFGYYKCIACGTEWIEKSTYDNFDEIKECHLSSCPNCDRETEEVPEATLTTGQCDAIYRHRNDKIWSEEDND